MATPKKATQQPKPYSNPQETLSNSSKGSSIAKDIRTEKSSLEQKLAQRNKESQSNKVANPEFKQVFSLTNHKESHDKQKRIQELQVVINEIRREVQAIKARSEGIVSEVDQIEKATIESLPERVGIYHVRHFELILEYLRNIRSKVGEAKTWLMAMQSKKGKRGSAFSARSKKKGTQYSLSQELSAARSTS